MVAKPHEAAVLGTRTIRGECATRVYESKHIQAAKHTNTRTRSGRRSDCSYLSGVCLRWPSLSLGLCCTLPWLCSPCTSRQVTASSLAIRAILLLTINTISTTHRDSFAHDYVLIASPQTPTFTVVLYAYAPHARRPSAATKFLRDIICQHERLWRRLFRLWR